MSFSLFNFQLNLLSTCRHQNKAQELREKSQAHADSISILEEKVSKLSESFDKQEEKLKNMILDSEVFQKEIEETNAAFQTLESKVLGLKALELWTIEQI